MEPPYLEDFIEVLIKTFQAASATYLDALTGSPGESLTDVR